MRANPDGYAYSTLKPGEDWKDGGGVVDAFALDYCFPGPSGPTWGGGPLDIDLETGDPPPSGDYADPSQPPGWWMSAGPGSSAMNQALPPSDGSRKSKVLAVLPNLIRGDRLRLTVSWDNCIEGSTVAPAPLVTDLDLFLYNVDRSEYYYTSQTFDDNNEGFEVKIEPGWEGTYQVILAWPDGANGCAGSRTVPIGWTYLLWQTGT